MPNLFIRANKEDSCVYINKRRYNKYIKLFIGRKNIRFIRIQNT